MDHQRVSTNVTRMSCGVMELSSLSDDITGVLYQLGARLYHPARGEPVAFFVFSDIVTQGTNSSRLATEVINLGLGSITISARAQNPKTANEIVVYVWAIDHFKFKKWYGAERVNRLSKVGAN